jgi:hypothetical protein
MADTASSILLLRLQGTGDNINLWGGYLNVALQTLERGQRGYESVTVNGDSTISWSNYAASNSFAVGLTKLVAGTVSASFTTTLPSYAMRTAVWNNSGHNAGIKTSGGTPITIPTGYYANVFNDGSNIISPPLFVNGVAYGTEGTADNNLATRAGVSALIAAASIPGADGTVKMDAGAASKYLNAAILVSGDVTKTDNGDTMTIGVSVPALDEGQVIFLSQVFG